MIFVKDAPPPLYTLVCRTDIMTSNILSITCIVCVPLENNLSKYMIWSETS